MKKLTAMLAMLLSVSILLCACGSKADGGDTADDSNSGEGDKILVGMVTDMAIDQAEWLQNLVAGVDEYNKSNEYNVEFKVIEATDVSEYEPKLRALAESGYSVIMGMYSAMVDPILAVAADYPDIKFGSLDGNIENIADYENVGEFGLDRLQTGFLAGCAAALMSESGLVGIAGGDGQVARAAHNNGYLSHNSASLKAKTGAPLLRCAVELPRRSAAEIQQKALSAPLW